MTVTPKQKLALHIQERHFSAPPKKITLDKLREWHRREHQTYRLTHEHGDIRGRDTYVLGTNTGSELQEVQISLSPPKNPSSNNAKDRNWTLHLANMSRGMGWRYELPGTRADDPEQAIREANVILAWAANWEPIGWGWRVKDGTGQ